MQVRWTPEAADDFARIIEWIRAESPQAALRVAPTIYKAVAELPTSPRRGRIGLAPNSRELVFPPWPYIVVYEIADDQVIVLRVRHASREWP